MNFRKNSTLIVGCAAAVVLLAVALVFLIKNQKSYQSNVEEFNVARNRLNTLNTRDPFPSAGNVKLAGDNLEILKAKYGSAEESLLNKQLSAETIEPARFAPLLEEAFRRVRNRAATNNVILPAEAGLGFKDYAEGKLPPNDPKVMERLIIQVKALEDLISLMVDAKVHSVDTLQRENFETKLGDASAPPPPEDFRRGVAPGRDQSPEVRSASGVPLPTPNPLYQTERFTIGFTGRESAIWEALNRLVSSKITYVIKDVSIESTVSNLGKPVDMKARLTASATGRQTSTPGAGNATPVVQASLESISREDRVVGGRELIKAKVVVDMYRFVDSTQMGGQP
jgi:hypothetical protein